MIPSALITDLYELTMLAGYDQAGVTGRATFELFVRNLPAGRAYLVAAGLEQALQYLDRAAKAPPRPGRESADKGRRAEIAALTAKVKKELG